VHAQPGATVQVLGWDEAFTGVHTQDPEGYARQVQRAVLERTRLHCSVGIGDTLVRAIRLLGLRAEMPVDAREGHTPTRSGW
jgi:nucleotidyltransferase/DNA polymerase involved in DNA repair